MITRTVDEVGDAIMADLRTALRQHGEQARNLAEALNHVLASPGERGGMGERERRLNVVARRVQKWLYRTARESGALRRRKST